jgi:hypothetical protein
MLEKGKHILRNNEEKKETKLMDQMDIKSFKLQEVQEESTLKE